ncbi:PREDICTED: cytochrome P450 9e2-like [Nicrophorus vespilloides]|uniref:Cytochrome P450 9e2-like n=1 Tax=Nicrophorus vespilloides TaxID=110193 RepID=A0ABM1M6D4_NICVS|nr:PREDICTED: cytochrome P450 9e2-like [Nicrophorus vespilloides]
MFTLLLIFGLAVILFYYVFLKSQLYWSDRNVTQGPPIPIIGDNLKTVMRKESFFEMIKRLYIRFPNERYTGIYQMTTPTLMLRDPDLIKQIAVKDFDYFTDRRSFVPDDCDPLWNKNLFVLKGEKWRDMRATLSPAFTSSKMRAMFTLINDCSKKFVDFHLEASKDGEITVEMKDIFTRYSNDVIATCAFGVTCDSLKEPKNEFYEMGREASDFTSFIKNLKFFLYILMPKISKVINITLFNEKVSNFFKNLVKETIKLREENGIVRPDMLNLMMEARKGRLKHEEANFNDTGFATVEESHIGKMQMKKHEITDIDITAQALIFFFAGFDTSSTLMSFMAYELAVNPDIQAKLIAEVDDTYEECDGKLNYEKLATMKYMDLVISETLRKWPSVIAAERVCVKPYTIPAAKESERPVNLVVGDAVWFPIVGIHYDPEYFSNPDTFDPDRYSEENKHNINSSTYFPFGIGPRNCIGSRFALMETKTVFFQILSKFEITVTSKTVIPVRMSKTQFNLTSEDGYWLGLKPRQYDA